jgi:hypothetical protein
MVMVTQATVENGFIVLKFSLRIDGCISLNNCWSYGLGPFILINALKEFKIHY